MLRCPKCKKKIEHIVARYTGTLYLYEDERKTSDMTDFGGWDNVALDKCECPECDYEGTRDTFTEVE